MKTQRGFTLIELMIVVAIVGIISVIALPAYTSYIARGKLVDAQSALTAARVAMEQYYQDHRTYVGGEADVPTGACPLDTTYFSYACASTATTFNITASNINGQGLGAAGSYVYTIDSSNAKSTTTFPGGKTSATTWLSK